jgi:dUTP pyrophosphatase
VLNTPGTVDSGYRGEVGVIAMNHSDRAVILKKGERIAQLVICPVVRAEFVQVRELPDSARGEGGFGSTGV